MPPNTTLMLTTPLTEDLLTKLVLDTLTTTKLILTSKDTTPLKPKTGTQLRENFWPSLTN